MTLQRGLITAIRILGVTVVYMLLFVITSSLGVPPDTAAQVGVEQATASMAAMPAVALLTSVAVSYLILRSSWFGWRLAAGMAFVFFGVHTFLQQVETMAFPAVAGQMPPGLLASLFWVGAVLAVTFSPLAVLILGKWRAPTETESGTERLVMPIGEWAWKLIAVIVAYEAIYFLFGYFVAWRTPGLPEFYGGTDPGSFFAQLGNVMRDTPWLPLLQAARALGWVLFVGPAIRWLKGSTAETALAIGAFLSLVVASQLLIPNPFMPPAIARAHQVELALSDLVFGAFLGGLLVWRPTRRRLVSPRPVATETRAA